ncbi:MAG: DUF4350 domain-containing protein [Mucilaginibacter sp.]
MPYRYVTLALVLFAGSCVDASAQKVTLDYYFNHEVHQTAGGKTERYHYLWDDKANSGFSVFGDAFKGAGATLDTLDKAPSVDNLKGTGIYIIVDPDTKKENPGPNYVQPKHIREIATWVKGGGILLLMANDSANVELPHFNRLAAKFGMHFNNDLQNHVIDDGHFEDGAIVTAGSPVFKTAKKIFMKDACSISVSGAANPMLKNNGGAVIMAVARYGKGAVIAIGDPWLYNEYTNGRLPASFENDKAARDLAGFLVRLARR